jgi:hypothetical protein
MICIDVWCKLYNIRVNVIILYRLLLFAPTAFLETPLRFELWLGVYFSYTVFGLCFGTFPTEECNRPVTLRCHWSQLRCGGISVYLKGLCKVWVGQYYLFGNGSLYLLVKRLLMGGLPPAWFHFSTISFGGFSLSALSH